MRPVNPIGPHLRTHEQRRALMHELAERACAKHGEEFLATAVYGSLARSADGP